MSNEWDTWKVGDVLVSTGKYVPGFPKGRRGIIAEKRPNGLILDLDNGNKSRWDYIDSLGLGENISFYWTHIPPTPTTWTVGERVRREAIKDSPSGIPAGTEGTVHAVMTDLISITWDGYGLHSYDLPLRHALFSKISTGHSQRPVLCCVRCGEYTDYAEANQADGTHKCFLCRKYPYR